MDRSRGGNRGNYKRGGWQQRRGWYNRGNNKRSYDNNRDAEASTSQRQLQEYFPDADCPYKGWKFYFPSEEYKENHALTRQLQYFENYFTGHKHLYKLEDIETERSFTVNFKELTTNAELNQQMPRLKDELISAPEKVLASLGLAMHQLLWLRQREQSEALQNESDDDDEQQMDLDFDTRENSDDIDFKMILARLVNYDLQTPLRALKASYCGQLVTIKGTVVAVGNIKPFCTHLAFRCMTCSSKWGFTIQDGKHRIPEKCISRECRGKTFTPDTSSKLTRTVDWQKIRIQEMNETREDVSGVSPTMECELMCDLVDTCIPGDVVILTGIVKVNKNAEGTNRNLQDKCCFTLYIEANSICNNRGNMSDSTSAFNELAHQGSIAMEFSMEELYAIREIHERENLFYLIVNSLCPTIYGHEMVKAGLLLGLLGGTQKPVSDKLSVPIRGDPHILVVGDPGLGKSQMLQACANISPRGVYVCGKTTTTSGLTVTMTKDGSNDSSLRAGALVLSNQGCCCIDEFDKMGAQQEALLEVMEQQCISIAKAGILCTLPAKTSILAAANPAGGHYNKAKTVSENLKISAALLSRFDLVFILVDKPDEDLDKMLSEHVMAMHAGMPTSRSIGRSQAATPLLSAGDFMPAEPGTPLSERLKCKKGDNVDRIPQQLLRKYIGYARQYVHPKITPPAANVLQKFYLELRKRHQTMDSTPITTRQLESLIRLSEARARLELREEVMEEDAKDVVEIMKYSLIDTYSDSFGILDFQRSQHGSGMSGRSLPKKFISILTQLAERTSNSLFTMQKMKDVLQESHLHVQDFEGFIDTLNHHGYLVKKGPREYQLHTV